MSLSNAKPHDAASAARPGKLERYCAWAMLGNATLGLIVALVVSVPPVTSILGLVAGVLAVRGKIAGLVGGLLFYGLQVLSYYSPAFHFNFRSGISLAAVVSLPHGIMVVNMAAGAGLAVTIWLLARRVSSRGDHKAGRAVRHDPV